MATYDADFVRFVQEIEVDLTRTCMRRWRRRRSPTVRAQLLCGALRAASGSVAYRRQLIGNVTGIMEGAK